MAADGIVGELGYNGGMVERVLAVVLVSIPECVTCCV